MSFTTNQYKAIAMWAEKNGAVPQLSSGEKVRFMFKDNGEITEVYLSTLMREFENHRKELAREKARQRREGKI